MKYYSLVENESISSTGSNREILVDPKSDDLDFPFRYDDDNTESNAIMNREKEKKQETSKKGSTARPPYNHTPYNHTSI